ncbi:Cytochrome P450 82C4 [Acorus calamus]|uniref:Cytochrome P450 82C4 n=1 Tax=Acorus calamus TaxID=4465 RepID=A0AAV9EU52_ACOCL|nr:Cytochrome P450 82C4 [Acorus calamus]
MGGTDTTTLSLTWAIALLVNDCRVLKKAQEELDVHVGLDRNIDESDIKSLTCLHATVKEVMRLYPARCRYSWHTRRSRIAISAGTTCGPARR